MKTTADGRLRNSHLCFSQLWKGRAVRNRDPGRLCVWRAPLPSGPHAVRGKEPWGLHKAPIHQGSTLRHLESDVGMGLQREFGRHMHSDGSHPSPCRIVCSLPMESYTHSWPGVHHARVHAKHLCCVGDLCTLPACRLWQMGLKPWIAVCEHGYKSGQMPWGAGAGSLASACATL